MSTVRSFPVLILGRQMEKPETVLLRLYPQMHSIALAVSTSHTCKHRLRSLLTYLPARRTIGKSLAEHRFMFSVHRLLLCRLCSPWEGEGLFAAQCQQAAG